MLVFLGSLGDSWSALCCAGGTLKSPVSPCQSFLPTVMSCLAPRVIFPACLLQHAFAANFWGRCMHMPFFPLVFIPFPPYWCRIINAMPCYFWSWRIVTIHTVEGRGICTVWGQRWWHLCVCSTCSELGEEAPCMPMVRLLSAICGSEGASLAGATVGWDMAARHHSILAWLPEDVMTSLW